MDTNANLGPMRSPLSSTTYSRRRRGSIALKCAIERAAHALAHSVREGISKLVRQMAGMDFAS
jgi:hypothetical protein